jgi:hypothetical protein
MIGDEKRHLNRDDDKTPALGLGVDAYGGPVVDPSKNVFSFVNQAVIRLNDIADVREKYTEKINLLDEKLRDEVQKSIKENITLRSEYQEKLAVAESKRSDANRAFDLANVAIASERAAAQATVLASQLQTAAETLRTTTAASDARNTTLIQNLESKFNDRMMALEKNANLGAGRQAMADPLINELATKVAHLSNMLAGGSGEKVGSKMVWAYVVAGIGLLVGTMGPLIALIQFIATKK